MDNKYKSLYSPNKEIRANQYIIEIICKNKAAANKISLPLEFTKLPEWAQFYKSQLRKCNEYLEKYHELILIKVIKDKNIYSLYAKWIDREFQKETEKTLALAKSIEKININRVTNSIGRQDKDLQLGNFDD